MSFQHPVHLVGRYLELVPLGAEHAAPLTLAAQDPEIWRFWRSSPPSTRGEMDEFIRTLLERQSAGTDLPFTVIRRSDGAPVGMTRFLEIEREHGAVEIGGTWTDPSLWRTPFNTESKRLMLGFAFDAERVHRVQFKTDLRNLRSQRAIERLGAFREGVLRDHLVVFGGIRRSSVYYSVLEADWPSVRDRLDAALARPWDGDAPRPR